MDLLQFISTAAVALGISAGAYAQSTLPAGSSQIFNHSQPGLVIHHVMAKIGSFPSESNSTTDSIATVHLYAGSDTAYGEPSLQGQLFSKTGNELLFYLLGTDYGGDGVTQFALPDLRGRFTVGTGTPDWTASTLQRGQVFGNQLLELTLANMPKHRHTIVAANALTTYAGESEPLSLLSPSMPMTYIIAVEGNFPNTLIFPMIGMIRAFAGNFVPGGWLPADGRLLNISENDALFDVIGTLYGGDGVTTFALPDLRGRLAVGHGFGAGLDLALGQSIGSAQASLGTAQLPAHSHNLSGGGSTSTVGGSQTFSNLQPSLAIKYLMATQGTFASDANGSFSPEVPTLGEIIAFAGNTVPTGSVECAGQQLAIAQNQLLFSLLGTTFGGNGQTTFALPNLRGRAPVGVGGGLIAGQTVGAAETLLTTSTMTTHTHAITYEVFEDGFE